MKRVVVTGMGVVSPLGFGVQAMWESLLKSKNGIRKIDNLDIQGEIVNIAGVLPSASFSPDEFPELTSHIPEDDTVLSFFKSVQEAVGQSGLNFDKMDTTDRVGLMIADRKMSPVAYIEQFTPLLAKSSQGDNLNEKQFFNYLLEHGIKKKPQFHDSGSINHITSRVYKITGPQLSIGTACASGNNAIGEAFLKIARGSLDVALAGGAFNYDLSAMVGFTRIGALTHNSDPETACSPFDKKRSGFVMGSGCGILILEDLEYATKRGADILCEIKGYGCYSDAYRATDPDPKASGATRTMKAALDLAGINPDELDYINAHGTSTQMNDLTETRAIKNVLGEEAYKTPVSSTKSMVGHGIMAAGAIEGVACIKSIQQSVIHPTRNWVDRDPELDLDYVPNEPREQNIDYALSNNFGFGGQNASIVYAKFR